MGVRAPGHREAVRGGDHKGLIAPVVVARIGIIDLKAVHLIGHGHAGTIAVRMRLHDENAALMRRLAHFLNAVGMQVLVCEQKLLRQPEEKVMVGISIKADLCPGQNGDAEPISLVFCAIVARKEDRDLLRPRNIAERIQSIFLKMIGDKKGGIPRLLIGAHHLEGAQLAATADLRRMQMRFGLEHSFSLKIKYNTLYHTKKKIATVLFVKCLSKYTKFLPSFLSKLSTLS